ncbi:chloramphenicol-sensitive protein RarD [Cricetibacter osteomyelitidis]|uniref:Chloramphenicol-sensitive protein RarD n=1 Tax=Cricetibacter osteomyelitidis TaxID=1521931 RepID=A0A4V2T2F5_9PAST|nr:EamA family transporter RarD [Cricetibacter osteomyelitidis]TCP97243.1 chloramphenicol-sensitive protein RarD [Cricetibacter osteomyelitidis]
MFKGVATSLLASILFGYMYYFSTLLQPLSGEGIFGYRIIFTMPFIYAAIILFKQKQQFIARLIQLKQRPALLLIYILCSGIIGFQMWLFLWAPNNGSAISTSFGYLLLPLVLVVIARIIFKEQITKIKMLAVAIAATGVISNIIIKGGFSWESIVVCIGYTIYFSVRKYFKIADLSSFCIEMTLLLPVCIYFARQVDFNQIQQHNEHILYLLPVLGLISGTALIAYILASVMLPMNLLGLLGYVETILMVVISFFIGEKVDAESYPLFICLSIAMMLIIIDGIYRTLHKKT